MYFSDPVLFELPVLPRTRKYIAGKLQDPAGNTRSMLLSPHGEGAGLMLWAMAQAPKVLLQMGWRRRQKSDSYLLIDGASRIVAPPSMTAVIGVGIQQFHTSRHQYLLNYAELEVFGNFVDYVIINELIGYCKREPETAPMVRIKQFCDHYDFSEEDFSEQSLRRAYQRFRKNETSYGYSEPLARQRHFEPYSLAA